MSLQGKPVAQERLQHLPQRRIVERPVVVMDVVRRVAIGWGGRFGGYVEFVFFYPRRATLDLPPAHVVCGANQSFERPVCDTDFAIRRNIQRDKAHAVAADGSGFYRGDVEGGELLRR